MLSCLDLFAGRQSFATVARARGHSCLTVEKYPEPPFTPDHLDVLDLPPVRADVIWASPPCTGFSIAAVSHHWTMHPDGSRSPKSDTARHGLVLMRRAIEIATGARAFWFIENPRGVMRKVIEPYLPPGAVRRTVTYCQYGDTRMKPTDIWTNLQSWSPRPMCRPGAPCHEAAPRGSKTGTQGLKGAAARSVVPAPLFHELFDEIERILALV